MSKTILNNIVAKLGSLSYEELIELNKTVVGQCRQVSRSKMLSISSEFFIGQKVEFTKKSGQIVSGNIERINKKTISVTRCSDGSRGWRVPPSMIRVSK